MEVVLKFAKLHDNVDFYNEDQVHSYFDEVLFLDFIKYGCRSKPLLPETISGLIEGYNATPENFQVPSEEIINKVVSLVENQIKLDLKNDFDAKLNTKSVFKIKSTAINSEAKANSTD